ncbi:MAG: GntR family transcriptional regulator [Bifidobacteriaceae bacterium]|nr:GntR family transcriptional regulator [Bifidobacteriaceae bacterium]
MVRASPSESPRRDPQGLSERVYQATLQILVQGNLASGQTLRIDELANALGVSPTPVREALAKLEATGLVERRPHRGYRVPAPLTPAQLRDLIDARILIEVASVVRASTVGGDSFRTDLEDALHNQDAAVEAYQLAKALGPSEVSSLSWSVIEADLRFHAVIFEHTRNSFYQLMADSLQGQLHRVRQSIENGISDALEALSEHRAIAEAVTSADPAAIARAMRRHLESVGDRSGAAPPGDPIAGANRKDDG